MATSGGRHSTDETSSVMRVAQTRLVQRNQLLTPDMIDTVDWHCYSAPQSRSGSFKKSRGRTGLTDCSPRSSLPSLEDSITAKLLELQQLEADDCRVVRAFVTSSRGGIVHRADSFCRNREATADKNKMTKTQRQRQTQTQTDRQQQSAAAAVAAAVETSDVVGRGPDQLACKVIIAGDRAVGKTALLQQLMTSHYMAAMNTCSVGQ